ncbi:hypothetical protein [Empedobacter brevis]|uniref:hypothetical protein n=1 Tax=Empedobacter brevis TaxID=247 RepID=UPI003341D536
MKNLKISTGNPLDLKNSINDKISNNLISSWELDSTGNIISHKGGQYKNHFYFEYKLDLQKGILEFEYHSNGTSDFADSRSKQLLERMLESHFKNQIEIIK